MQVAMSNDSLEEAAKHGFKMLQFAYKTLDVHAQEVATYAKLFREKHHKAPPILFFVDFLVCDENADRAAENANKHIRTYLLSLMQHYEMMNDHFSKAKGYEEYGRNAQAMAEAGLEAIADGYLASQTWGSPQQILDKISARRAALGDYDALYCVRFAGTPFDVVERTLRTFAKKVMPELKSWNISGTMAA